MWKNYFGKSKNHDIRILSKKYEVYTPHGEMMK